MKVEVKYPDKPAHEVELKGKLAVVGRDPACDLVINDERCSRRHAVLESTPTGLQVRDAGSANGVFVNGKKRERSSLVAGDLIRLGEVILKVLPDGPAGTVVMAPDDVVDLGPAPPASGGPSGPAHLGTAPQPVAAVRREAGLERRAAAPHRRGSGAERPGPASRGAPRASGRPLTVTLLASLWVVSIFLYAASALSSRLLGLEGTMARVNLGFSTALALLSAALAFGLFGLRPWARLLQIGTAAIGLILCPFTLASATTLIYMLRPSTRTAFSSGGRDRPEDPAETTFALTLLGTTLLGAALSVAGVLATRFLG